jgi:hypothetical protein
MSPFLSSFRLVSPGMPLSNMYRRIEPSPGLYAVGLSALDSDGETDPWSLVHTCSNLKEHLMAENIETWNEGWTRRELLTRIGQVGGAAALYETMTALGLINTPDQYA